MMKDTSTILIKICEKLNLPESLYEKLEQRYKSISEFLMSRSEFSNVKIYPQGSVAIGTTVKPIGQNEYDLDFVYEKEDIDSSELFNLFNSIKNLLKSNGNYSNLVEEKKRCVRLNYKEEFHIDILPACIDTQSLSSTGILIPDKELKKPLPSDPKGYANWFLEKSRSTYKVDGIEVLPQYQKAIQKSYLQLTVQLMKRHRDIFFKNQPKNSPPSIIITTLCGEYYKDQGSILDNMIYIVGVIGKASNIEVRNPVNPKELLSEKWKENPDLHKIFMSWIDSLLSDLQSLKNKENLDEKLKNMFGEKIMIPILDELEDRESIHIHKKRKTLSVSSAGVLSASPLGNTPVVKHTFFGD